MAKTKLDNDFPRRHAYVVPDHPRRLPGSIPDPPSERSYRKVNAELDEVGFSSRGATVKFEVGATFENGEARAVIARVDLDTRGCRTRAAALCLRQATHLERQAAHLEPAIAEQYQEAIAQLRKIADTIERDPGDIVDPAHEFERRPLTGAPERIRVW